MTSMAVCSLRVWNGGEELASDDGWIVAESDEEYFDLEAREAGLERPRLYVVSTKAATRPAVFLKAFQYRLQDLGVPASVELAGIDNDAQLFFGAWESLVSGINTLDPHVVRHARIAMSRHMPREFFLWRTESLLEFLEDYVNRARRLVLEESPVGLVPLTSRRNDWWEDDCKWTKSFDSLATRVGELEGADSRLKSALIDPLVSVRNLARTWKRGSAEIALSTLWPHFVRAALDCTTQRKHNMVVIYVHRALDVYFQMHGIREGVVVAGDGLSYRFPRWDRETVTLCETERRLVREAGWIFEKDRSSFLWEVNRARNLLLETHGVYECAAAEASLSVSKFEKLLRRVGDQAEIARLNEAKTVVPRLSPCSLFEVEDGFGAFVVRAELGVSRASS